MPSAKYFKKVVTRLFVLVAILFSIASIVRVQPIMAAADIKKSLCTGIYDTTGGSEDCSEDKTTNVKSLAVRVIDIFSWVIGVLAVIMLIVGGFRYIISGGDSNGISGAKNTIIYAIVGLVIVIFAQTIVKFVVTNITKSPSSSQPSGGTPATPPAATPTPTPTGPSGGSPTPVGPGGETP